MTEVKDNAVVKEAKAEVSANPAAIEWSQDEYRVTTALRSAGVTAAGRVGTDMAKLKVFLSTLDTLRGHAIARVKKNKAEQETMLATVNERQAREAELNETRRAAEVARLEKQLDYVRSAQ